MKYIKICDSKGNNRFIRLYSTKRSKNVIAVKTAAKEILYAGSGTSISGPSVMKVQTAAGTQDICEYADEYPQIRSIASYTTTQDVVLSKDLFPLGGMITAESAKGVDSYGAGGKGSTASMFFGALLHDTTLHITIGVNNGNAGTAGTNVPYRTYYACQYIGTYNTPKCVSPGTVSSSNATSGGAGGAGVRVTLDYTGETINAYGGGGGGGNRGSLYYKAACTTKANDCAFDYLTEYGSYGSGGAAGNGVAGSGVNGGSAGGSDYARVIIYAFME